LAAKSPKKFVIVKIQAIDFPFLFAFLKFSGVQDYYVERPPETHLSIGKTRDRK
jgi:hypothetical protein